jgi:TldD protein
MKVIRQIVLALLTAILLLLASAAAWATDSAPDDVLLRAMREEMERSKDKLKMDGLAAPYYIEYRVNTVDQFEAAAVFGALRAQQRQRGRLLRVVVRLGDYKQDSFFGTGEGAADLLATDDDLFALRHRLWLATDRAYKAAGEALSAKQAALKKYKVDEPVDDFSRAPVVAMIEPLARLSTADFTPWVRLIEEASNQFRSDPQLESAESNVRFVAQNRYFLNSEGTVARTGNTHFEIHLLGSTQAADGMLLQRSYSQLAHDLGELPTREHFLETTTKLFATLQQLRDAPVVDEDYRGPVLLTNDAAGSVIAELVEPNILGRKPNLGQNSRTTGKWSTSLKSRVLPDFINVYDDPTISTLAGHPLFGKYAVDDEGVKAQRVSLIEKGQLVSYLVSRQPIRDFPVSNGHGRSAPTGTPQAEPGNLIVQSTDPQPDGELKKKLIDLCKQRDLPYCFYVGTMGPRLSPRLLYRVWTKDGHEELVRGGVFGDLDIRSLRSNLIAAGTEPAIEDRPDPIAFSVACPALLFDELEVKRSEATKQKLPVYPPPPLTHNHE